ncbi:FecR family protein [Chitinophaga niastensis]|uniref:FecR family protein n=2 Tax=Chitinophaga niastensis TaxID=536980 RepID=A0A2P8HVK7_CHINA|nr:FecR family protein [Chitinophaga niastensis]
MAREATDAELMELERLLREQPEAQYTMELMTAIWKNEREEEEAGVFDRYWPQLQEEEADVLKQSAIVPLRSKRKLWMAAVITGICVLAATAWLMRPYVGRFSQPVAENEVTTREGSRSKIKLPDGTQVWLNGGSKLTYNDDMKHAGTREVYLSGEACFDVAKDAEKPFIIHAGKMQVNVLGTVLNVRAYNDDSKTEATLVSGRIEVLMKDVPGQKIHLQPGEKLILYNNSQQKITPKQPAIRYSVANASTLPNDSMLLAETSWVENKLVFNNEKMPDILKKMEHWYNVSFEVNNEQINAVHFSGAFQDETVTEALTAMQQILHFQFTVKGNKIIIN